MVAMSPSKTEPKLSRCHISAAQSKALTGDPDAMGEGFWIKKKSKTTAEVCNILMCGIGIGDIIVVKEYPENDGEHHPNEFVRLKKRVCNVCYLAYTFEGQEKTKETGKFPQNVQEFINSLIKHGIKFEGMVSGYAALQCPIDMEEHEFIARISVGPIKFEIPSE